MFLGNCFISQSQLPQLTYKSQGCYVQFTDGWRKLNGGEGMLLVFNNDILTVYSAHVQTYTLYNTTEWYKNSKGKNEIHLLGVDEDGNQCNIFIVQKKRGDSSQLQVFFYYDNIQYFYDLVKQ